MPNVTCRGLSCGNVACLIHLVRIIFVIFYEFGLRVQNGITNCIIREQLTDKANRFTNWQIVSAIY